MVFGLMEDKNAAEIISELRHIAKRLYVVEAKTQRSRKSVELAQEGRRMGASVKDFPSVREGVSSALDQRDGAPVLITGSHFVVGEALAYLHHEKYLTINQ